MDTEDRLERWRDADTWPAERSLAAMLDSQMAAFDAVRNALPALARAAEAAAERLRSRRSPGVCRRRRVGAARRAGRRRAASDLRLAARASVLSDRGRRGGAGALDRGRGGRRGGGRLPRSTGLALGAADVLVAVAASGRTAFTCVVQRRARAAGALTIGLANNPGSPLLEEAEIPVLLATGPEFLAGSNRMTAGTAQKIALNLLVDPDHDGAGPGVSGLHGRRGAEQR